MYLKELERIGLLHGLKVGRELNYINDNFSTTGSTCGAKPAKFTPAMQTSAVLLM